MDIFVEKIVKRQKSIVEMLLITLIVGAAAMISYLLIRLIPQFSTFLIIALLYLAYILITKFNIEYEYALTNGDLDIDVIIDQKRRKRLLSAKCQDFEIVAKVNSSQYTRDIKECKNKKDYTSRRKEAEVWFILMRDNGKQTVVLFEPLEKMIDNIATYIPRKVFRN
ncbi:MAG: DUF6106 family protein [Acetivibrionales bacterium]|jgi:hypothetical protein|nr:hypothetical protein [Clostridiaceae bacterium]